jgi:hypothetical protein
MGLIQDITELMRKGPELASQVNAVKLNTKSIAREIYFIIFIALFTPDHTHGADSLLCSADHDFPCARWPSV